MGLLWLLPSCIPGLTPGMWGESAAGSSGSFASLTGLRLLVCTGWRNRHPVPEAEHPCFCSARGGLEFGWGLVEGSAA